MLPPPLSSAGLAAYGRDALDPRPGSWRRASRHAPRLLDAVADSRPTTSRRLCTGCRCRPPRLYPGAVGSSKQTLCWREPDSNHRSGRERDGRGERPAANHCRLERRPVLNDPIQLIGPASPFGNSRETFRKSGTDGSNPVPSSGGSSELQTRRERAVVIGGGSGQSAAPGRGRVSFADHDVLAVSCRANRPSEQRRRSARRRETTKRPDLLNPPRTGPDVGRSRRTRAPAGPHAPC